MRISLVDRSLYYKGLMLLIRKDHEIRKEEMVMMMRIGEMLGFEPDFCRNAVEEIIGNRYVDDTPPLFSGPSVANCFVKDGLRVSASDGQIHKKEVEWLKSVAEINGLDRSLFAELETFDLEYLKKDLGDSLELRQFQWE